MRTGAQRHTHAITRERYRISKDALKDILVFLISISLYFFQIYDDVGIIRRYCQAFDQYSWPTMKTRTGLLGVFFKSDTINNDRGFNLTYQAVISKIYSSLLLQSNLIS